MIEILLQTVLSKTEIAIFENQVKVASLVKESLQKSNNTFIFDLKLLLDQLHKNLSNVDCVWIVNGPGYYTGIRIGLAIGMAIQDSLYIPIRLVNTFHWLYEGIESKTKFSKLYIPSSKREGFLAFVRNNRIEEIRFISLAEISEHGKNEYETCNLYSYADSLSFGLAINDVPSLPGVYKEVSSGTGIVPNYMKSEEELFTKKS